MVYTLFQRPHDGSAACSLRRIHPRQVAVDETDLAQFAEPSQNPRQQRAAGDWRDDVPRETPAKLLDDLEPVGFCAFRVVGAQVDVDESPPVPIADLRAQP